MRCNQPNKSLRESFCPRLLAEHFGHDEDQDGAAESAPEEEVEERVSSCGHDGWDEHCDHKKSATDGKRSHSDTALEELSAASPMNRAPVRSRLHDGALAI